MSYNKLPSQQLEVYYICCIMFSLFRKTKWWRPFHKETSLRITTPTVRNVAQNSWWRTWVMLKCPWRNENFHNDLIQNERRRIHSIFIKYARRLQEDMMIGKEISFLGNYIFLESQRWVVHDGIKFPYLEICVT